jgi:hypothetical protein
MDKNKQVQALTFNEPTLKLMRCLIAEKPDPVEVATIERNFNIEKSIQYGTQMSKLADINSRSLLKLIVTLINRQSEFYNLRKTVTDEQAVMIAQTLIDEYGVENIEDVVLMFKMARAGNFGTIYGKLDGETIMSWMALYLDRKYERLEQLHHNRKHEALEVAPEILEALKAIEKPKHESQPILNHNAWKRWFWENLDEFTPEQLKAIEAQFGIDEHIATVNHYEKELEAIRKRK